MNKLKKILVGKLGKFINFWTPKKFIVCIIIAILLGIVGIIFLPYWYDVIIINYFSIKDGDALPLKIIIGLGYVIGVLLLIIQLLISNRRADATEKTAKAALESNTEQRYHNAVTDLKAEESFIRIGAIYNLYHISQSTDTYDKTIFDIFCEYIKRDKNKITIEEKQLIVDKLFRGDESSRVLKVPQKIDLCGVDLSGINFSDAELQGALLSKATLDGCIFDKTNLTGATLPGNLSNVESMKDVVLDKTNFTSSSNFGGLKMKVGSCKDATIRYSDLTKVDLTGTDLTNTDLTGSDLTGVEGLIFDQLSKVKCLHAVRGLDIKIENRLKTEKSELFEKTHK